MVNFTSSLIFLSLLIVISCNNPKTFSDSVLDPIPPLFRKWLPKRHQRLDVDEILAGTNQRKSEKGLVPLVIIPSLVGNILEAQLEDSTPPHWYCESNADWYRIWIDVQQLFGCFSYNMGIECNSGTYSSPQGVAIQYPGFGFVNESCEFLDIKHQFPIWHDIASILIQNFSYVDGISLRAAPYDWRMGPDAWEGTFQALKDLIEETYLINGNQSVAVASLSMGGPFFLSFLNRFVDQDWKDRYIQSFTSLSGVFGGSPGAIFDLIAPSSTSPPGDAMDLLNLLRSWGSAAWLTPFESLFGDKVFLVSSTKNYTSSAADIMELLEESLITSTTSPSNLVLEIFKNILPFKRFDAPGVTMNCVFGTNLSTPAVGLFYGDWTQTLNFTMENGDGSVLEPSLSICGSWQNDQEKPINVFQFDNMEHANAVFDPRSIKVLLNSLNLTQV